MALRSCSRLTCALALLLCAAEQAHAGGLELLPGGVRSTGRAGAVAARPDDAMALAHNPAALPWLSGDQFLFNIDLPISSLCVDPYGYYGWGIYDDKSSEFADNPLAVNLDGDGDPIIGDTYATTPLPQVCNSGEIAPIPQLAWAYHIGEHVSIAFGQVAPTLVTGAQWGGKDGTIDTDFGPRPTPTRYQVVRIGESGDFGASPAVGVAYRPIPQLSFGATLQVAMLSATSFVIQNATTGTQPATDWLVEAEAEDFFVPTVTIAAHAKPLPELDVMAAFRWADDFDGSGEVVFETNTFQSGDKDSGPTPFRNDPIDVTRIKLGLPWALTLAVRYAGKLPAIDEETRKKMKRPPAEDPMGTEAWDIEADFTYNFNERAGGTLAETGSDVSIVSREVGGGGDSQTVPLEDLASQEQDRHLEDSIAIRLGGSYSVIPRKLQVHAGAFYENRGVELAYANVDAFAFSRFGAGLGVMARFGPVDLMISYSHIFGETVEIAPPPHQSVDEADRDVPTSGFDKRVGGEFEADGDRAGGYVLEDPDAPAPEDADAVAALQQQSAAVGRRPERVINAGEYTSSFDIVSVGVTWRY